MGQIFVKDPEATLDYQIDWSLWLDSTDRITASTWTVPSGLTKVSDTFTNTTTTIWLSGGTVGATYSVVNHITTYLARQDDRTLEIVIEQK